MLLLGVVSVMPLEGSPEGGLEAHDDRKEGFAVLTLPLYRNALFVASGGLHNDLVVAFAV